MGADNVLPSWSDILILGGQLNPMPLPEDADVATRTIIGKNAKRPMVLDCPVYVSHMSFGALSKEAKIALAKGSAAVKTAMCSGEGGILPEEMDNSYKYIFEYTPREYSVSDKTLMAVDAIEIKVGQGTKPGIGGHLPGNKVTDEIARIRGVEPGKDVIAPSKYADINNKEDLKAKVDMLRARSEGRPIGIKIAAGRIEQDLEYCLFAKPDFITIDGRGGATAASPKILKESSSVPTIYALHRARKYLDENKADIDLVITGGLRVSSDFAKALAMGADAVAIAGAALISIGCQQYRICNTGRCPVGIATQDPELRARFDSGNGVKRLENFLRVSMDELKVYARICGKNNVHDINANDLCTINSDIANYTDIKHA
jgi:glutamate synthase domain-containing protein 2